MDVFLSWSGNRSKAVAEELKSWLKQVIQATEPWMSSSDIEKGATWSQELRDRLEKSKIGIICLTHENLSEPWILFEAGAVSKTKDAKVCTFLLDLQPADVKQPLGQFQHTTIDKEDVKQLVQTVNKKVQESGEKALDQPTLDKVFEKNWEDLSEQLTGIAKKQVSEQRPRRKEREILEEILEILRGQERERERGKLMSALLNNLPAAISFADALYGTSADLGDENKKSSLLLEALKERAAGPATPKGSSTPNSKSEG